MDVLALCAQGDWKAADAALEAHIKAAPDTPDGYAMAAHAVLRQGNHTAARWLVNKAQSYEANHVPARIEDICIDFYEAQFERAYKKLHPPLLAVAPRQHPVHLISAYLCCLYDDAARYAQTKSYGDALPGFDAAVLERYFTNDVADMPAWDALGHVVHWLQRGDTLLAGITARYAEILYPQHADSFAALGLWNLDAGFPENAARNLHEAMFRNSSQQEGLRAAQKRAQEMLHAPTPHAALNFEYAGLFIPKEHEGGAWPTETQRELLELVFLTPREQMGERWRIFTTLHSLYTLEAGAARLLPFLYKTLSNALPADAIAENALLKGIWKKSYFENALQMKKSLTTAAYLEKNGVQVTLLKGAANALALYDDLGARPMSDIDILIPAESVEHAHVLLLKEGWSNPHTPTAQRIRFAYGSTYLHADGGNLDIHWRPGGDLATDNYDAADFAPEASVDFLGRGWHALSPSLNLFCTILHGVEWNHLPPVRWVSDAALILSKHGNAIDWTQLHTLATKYGCLPPLVMGLRYLRDFAAIPDLPWLEADYASDPLMHIRLRPHNTLASVEEALAVLAHRRERFRFGEHDYIFICGGEDPAAMRHACAAHGVRWLAYADTQAMVSAVPEPPPFSLIVIDANLAGHFQCLSVRARQTQAFSPAA